MNSLHEIERTLLATMMMQPGQCWGVNIKPKHFASEHHSEICEMVLRLASDSSPVDPVTVSDHFERDGKRSLATLAVEIASSAMVTSAADAYAQRIIAGWRLREAAAIGQSLVGAREVASIDAAITALMDLHADEQRHEYTAATASKLVIARLTEIHNANGQLPGITTGLQDLDDKLGGLHAGDLIVVGGRAAMGKTSALIGMATAAARGGNPVGIISGEQPAEQVASRMISSAARMPAKDFRTADFDEAGWARVFRGFEETSKLPVWMLDRSAPTLAEVVRVARRWVHTHGIKALFIDYLQRIVGEGERRHEQVGRVAQGLKNLARDLNIPIIVLAQVSRAVEARQDPTPRMGDLSDSSEIEKEADQVLMLFREGYYKAEADQGTARIIVEKNRHGPTGYIDVMWHGETMTFRDLDKWAT